MIDPSSDDRLAQFKGRPPADPAAIAKVEAESYLRLPSDYADFLRCSNGGEGSVGASYVRLYRAEELLELNEGYSLAEFAPGLFLFGSDGGGEAFCFDMRTPAMPIVMMPFVPLDPEDAIVVGASFDEFLEALYAGRLFKSRRPGS